MQNDSTLHDKIKFSLLYRTKSVTLHEKRKTPFSLQPMAYVVMDRILDFGLLETLEAHSRQNSDFARILAFRRKCLSC